MILGIWNPFVSRACSSVVGRGDGKRGHVSDWSQNGEVRFADSDGDGWSANEECEDDCDSVGVDICCFERERERKRVSG